MTAAGRPFVLLAGSLPASGIERLEGRLEGHCEIRVGKADEPFERLLDLAPDPDVIVLDADTPVEDRLLRAAGDRLRLIANFGVGFDHIDLEACRRHGVTATNTPDVLNNATAEIALALTFAAARRLGEIETDLRADRWDDQDLERYLGQELSAAVFGVIGLGRIGRRYAELVGPLAERILYTGRRRQVDAEESLGVEWAELDQLLEQADVVSLHLPLTAENAGLIGADQLRLMKRSAILVNTARGDLVDSEALARALSEGRIAAAGLDVYEGEPHVPSVLLEAPRCTVLPHVGWATTRARDALADLVADNVFAVIRGDSPPNRI